MKRSIRLLLVLMALVNIALVVSPVFAYGTTYLDITPGASGAWVTDGYNFAGTADAQRSGFYALSGKTAFTGVLWINTNDIGSAAYQRILYEYFDGSNEFDLIQHQDDIGFVLEIGANHQEIYVNSLVTVGAHLQIVFTWASGDNSGKLDLYIGTTKGTSTSGVTGTTSLASEFIISPSGAPWNGITYSLALYNFKFSASKVAYNLAQGEDFYYANATHYWPMSEGAGTHFYEGGGGWTSSGEASFFMDTPGWILANTVIILFSTAAFYGWINLWVSISGLGMVAISGLYLVAGGWKSLGQTKIVNFAILLLLGFALFLGGIIASL